MILNLIINLFGTAHHMITDMSSILASQVAGDTFLYLKTLHVAGHVPISEDVANGCRTYSISEDVARGVTCSISEDVERGRTCSISADVARGGTCPPPWPDRCR